IIFVLTCLVMAALASASAQAPNTKAASGENGRWMVVPGNSSPLMDNQGTPFMYAWRLDTKTGGLEMCTYAPAGWGSLTKTETLTCSQVTPASNDPLGILR